MQIVFMGVVGFCLTGMIIYANTKEVGKAAGVGVGIDVVKKVLYSIRERLWNRVNPGRNETLDYEILEVGEITPQGEGR